jgi:endoglucanase
MKPKRVFAVLAFAILLVTAAGAAASDPLDTWSTVFAAAADAAAAGISTWIPGTRVSLDTANVNSGGKSVRTSGPVDGAHMLQPVIGLRALTGSNTVDLSDKTLNIEMYVPADSPVSWLSVEVTSGSSFVNVRTGMAAQKGLWCSYRINIALVLALGGWQYQDWMHSSDISSREAAVRLLTRVQTIRISAQADPTVKNAADAYFLIDSLGWEPSEAIGTPEFSAYADLADFPRRFHVEGNTFVDQDGNRKIFRGVSMPEAVRLAAMPDRFQPEWNEHYFQVMASWGADVVRVPVDPFTLHHIPWDSINTALDQTIAWAGRNKIYVIIDFHSCGSIAENWYNGYKEDPTLTTNMKEFLDFWNRISLRYANNDVVAFYELFNEPANPGSPPTKAMWMTWKGIAEKALAVVRANAPQKPVLVGGLAWAYDLSFALDAPVAGSNIGYVTHPYPKSASAIGKDWDAAFGKLSDRYPVIATEIGFQNDIKDFAEIEVNGARYSQAIVDYLEAHQISWTAWCFDDVWFTCLLADRNFTPTQSGAYFRDRLLAAKRSP